MTEPQWKFQVNCFKHGDPSAAVNGLPVDKQDCPAFGVLLGASHTCSTNVSSSIPRIEDGIPASTYSCTECDREKVQLSGKVHKCSLCSRDRTYSSKGLKAHLELHWLHSHKSLNSEPCFCCSRSHIPNECLYTFTSHFSVNPTTCPLSLWFEAKKKNIQILSLQPTSFLHERNMPVQQQWHYIRILDTKLQSTQNLWPNSDTHCGHPVCWLGANYLWQLTEQSESTDWQDQRHCDYNILKVYEGAMPSLPLVKRTVLAYFLLYLFRDRPELHHGLDCYRITLRSCRKKHHSNRVGRVYRPYYSIEYSLDFNGGRGNHLSPREICYNPDPRGYRGADRLSRLRKTFEEVL